MKENKIERYGINDYDGFVVLNNKRINSYRVWCSMLRRCYNSKYHKTKPTYIGCTVCDEWKNFSNFKRWFDTHYVEGYHLDKDILVKGNKVYSPSTCCFVPNEINALLSNNKLKRGNLPIGVTYRFNKFLSQGKFRGKQTHIGLFDTKEQAFDAYKKVKQSVITQMAKEYYDNGRITHNIYTALINYKVEITD